MNYSKPEITVLGNAVQVIQSSKTVGSPDDLGTIPAYELDEE